jgi:hypothetical protein
MARPLFLVNHRPVAVVVGASKEVMPRLTTHRKTMRKRV